MNFFKFPMQYEAAHPPQRVEECYRLNLLGHNGDWGVLIRGHGKRWHGWVSGPGDHREELMSLHAHEDTKEKVRDALENEVRGTLHTLKTLAGEG